MHTHTHIHTWGYSKATNFKHYSLSYFLPPSRLSISTSRSVLLMQLHLSSLILHSSPFNLLLSVVLKWETSKTVSKNLAWISIRKVVGFLIRENVMFLLSKSPPSSSLSTPRIIKMSFCNQSVIWKARWIYSLSFIFTTSNSSMIKTQLTVLMPLKLKKIQLTPPVAELVL